MSFTEIEHWEPKEALLVNLGEYLQLSGNIIGNSSGLQLLNVSLGKGDLGKFIASGSF